MDATFDFISHTHTHTHSMVTQGMLITGNPQSGLFGGDGDSLISFSEAQAVLLSAGYEAGTHPGYAPRSAQFHQRFTRTDHYY